MSGKKSSRSNKNAYSIARIVRNPGMGIKKFSIFVSEKFVFLQKLKKKEKITTYKISPRRSEG